MRLTPDGQLIVKTEGAWCRLDISFVYQAEDRIDEVQFVTPHKAPELLAFFNRVWLRLGEILSRLEGMLNTAKTKQDLVKAEILLDKCDAIFKEKGLKPSVDLRASVVSMSEDYQKVSNEVDSLKAAIALLEGKHKGIEMAYLSVRKIVGESAYNMRNSSGHSRDSESKPVGSVRREYGAPSDDYYGVHNVS